MATYARQLLVSAIVLAAGLCGASSQGVASADGGSLGRSDVEVAKTATPWVKVSTFPQTTAGLGEVSCVSSTCIAVGTIEGMSLVVSHNGGRSWSSPAVPTGVTTLESVSCATTLHCVAVGEYLQPGPTDERPGVVVVTNNGGRSWARQTTTAAGPLDAVSCASTWDCVAIGSVDENGNVGETFALATTTGGLSWVRAPIAGSQLTLYGLSCPSPRTCVGVGSDTSATNAGTAVVMVTTDGGARWRTAAVPGDDVGLYSVSCPTEAHCVATGSGQPLSSAAVTKPLEVVFTSTDGGQRWAQQRPLPGSGDYAGSVSCTASGWCLATGANVPLLSRDYGQSWTSAGPSAGFSTNVASVECPTAGDCVAVGGADGPSNGAYSFPFTYPTMATSTDGGRDWVAQRPPEGWLVDAMACPGPQSCVAVGTTNAGSAGAWATADFGRTWQEVALPRTVQILNSLSCPSPSTCTAVGSTVAGTAAAFTSTDGGLTWAASVLPKGLASLASVSCANLRLCVAVGIVERAA